MGTELKRSYLGAQKGGKLAAEHRGFHVASRAHGEKLKLAHKDNGALSRVRFPEVLPWKIVLN